MLLEALVEYKIVNSLDEITGAGHRAVHGGEIFKESVPVTEDVVEKFASLNDLAPLHNPAVLPDTMHLKIICLTASTSLCLIRHSIPQCRRNPISMHCR